MNKITVELTEDQASLLKNLLQVEIREAKREGSIDANQFAIRLYNKLAGVKN